MINYQLIVKSKKIFLILAFISFLILPSCDTSDDFIDLVNSCQNINRDSLITYPLHNSIFPYDIISPTIRWNYDRLDLNWLIQISIKDEDYSLYFTTEEDLFKIPKADWKFLKKYANQELKLRLVGYSSKSLTKAIVWDEIAFTISSDAVESPIFYRTVSLPFGYAVEHLETIAWRLGYVSDDAKPETVLEGLPVCGNCHSFSADGSQFGMDIDYGNDKGSFVSSEVSEDIVLDKSKIFSWSDYKRDDGEQTFGLLSSISPNGKYIISTLKDRSVFVKIDNQEYSQLFFPIKGILVYYDREKKTFTPLSGADDKQYVQSNPTWFPDGKKLLFARTKYYALPEIEKSKKAILPVELATDFVSRKKLFKYDLYTIDFNNGQGGTPVPLPGASNNGLSNYFAKVSPDGKWIVFTQAESFMLLMPDSKLYIMPATGGTPRLMNCNTINMNSWHSWSPNGKWLVFASKRNGPFTQLWLTHIDKDGNDSPPVLLENFSFDERACNIPEFVNIKGGKRFKMHEKFLESDYYGLQIGKSKINQGDFATAVKELTETLKIDPNNYDIYNMRAIAYSELKKLPEAIADFTKCIELKPGSEAYFNRASAKFTQNDFKGALADLNSALNFNKKDTKALYKRAIVKYNLEDFKGAVIDFDELINLDSKNYKAFYERALAKLQLGKIQDACTDLQKAKENGISEAQELLDKFCR